MNKAELLTLAERLESAPRPSPELSATVLEALEASASGHHVTGSVDSALLLMKTVLPMSWWFARLSEVRRNGGTTWSMWTATLQEDRDGLRDPIFSLARTPALAIVAATLRARAQSVPLV